MNPVPLTLPADASLYVFDFCGTLFRSNTTQDFIRYLARPGGPLPRGRYGAYRAAAALGRRLAWLSPAGHMRLQVRALRGLPRVRLADEARRFVAEWLSARRREAPCRLCEQALREQKPVVIASYTLDLLVDAFLAGRGNARSWTSTLAFDDRACCTGRYARQLHEIGKLPGLRDALGEPALRGAFFLTDDARADRDLLAIVRYPRVLHTDD